MKKLLLKRLGSGFISGGLAVGMSLCMMISGIVPQSPVSTGINTAYAAETQGIAWGYNNGRIFNKTGNLDEVVNYLNKNVLSIKVYTLGFRTLEEYIPSPYSDDNKLVNENGTLNPDYIAASAKQGSKGEDLKVFKNLERYRTNDRNTTIRFVMITFEGTNEHILMYYPEMLPTGNTKIDYQENVHEILGESPYGYKMYLKITMEPDGNTIKTIEDNNSRVDGPSGNIWASFVAGGGLKKYNGKTLTEVKAMDVGTQTGPTSYQWGVDSITGATATSIDVKKTVVNFLETMAASHTHKTDKSVLMATIKEADEIVSAASEYVQNEALKNLLTAVSQGKLVLKNTDAEESEVKQSVNAIKTALKGDIRLNPVKTNDLKAVLDKSGKLKNTDYTEESFKNLTGIIAKAKEIYEKSTKENTIRQVKIDEVTRELNEAISDLEEKDSDIVVRHKIKGRLVEFGSEDKPSMASGALNPEVQIKEIGGKTTYYLKFKPIEVLGAKSQVEDVKHIEKGQEKDTRRKLTDGEYNQTYIFTRNATNEKSFTLKLGARMGSPKISYQNVTLKLDLSEKASKSNVDKKGLESVLKEAAEVEKEIALGDYKEDGIKEFQTKYKRAKEVMADPNATEKDVDSAKRQLSSMIHLNLIPKPVDTSKVEPLIKQAESIDRSRYTEASLKDLDKALADVKAKKDRAETFRDVKNSQMEKAKKALENAISGLKEKTGQTVVDKKGLESVLKEAAEVEKEIALGDYKEDGIKEFQTKYKRAKEVMADPNATEKDVDSAKRQLSSMIHLNLIPKPVDTSKVEPLIKQAESIDRSRYTEASLKDLDKALADVKAKKDRAETFRDVKNSQMEKAKKALENAISGLKEKTGQTVVDKKGLESVLKEAAEVEKEIALGDYKEDGIKEFQTKYKRAKEVMADPNATEKDVDSAKRQLSSMIHLNLIPKPVDTSKVEPLIKQAESIDRSRYTEASLKDLDKALADVKAKKDRAETFRDVKNSQMEKAKKALENAISGLKEKTGQTVVDKKGLESVLKEAAEVEKEIALGDYKEDGIKEFQTKYKRAKEVMADPNATEKDVDSAKRQLSSMIHLNLIPKPVDTSKVEPLIKQAESIDRSRYTEASLKDLDKALADVKAKKDRAETFRDVKNSQMEKAKKALENAISGLKEKAGQTVVFEAENIKVEAMGISPEFTVTVKKLDTKVQGIDEIYDIIFTNKGEKQKIQNISALVTLKFKNDKKVDKLFYINDENKKIDITDSITENINGSVTFKTTHFSKYAIKYVQSTGIDTSEKLENNMNKSDSQNSSVHTEKTPSLKDKASTDNANAGKNPQMKANAKGNPKQGKNKNADDKNAKVIRTGDSGYTTWQSLLGLFALTALASIMYLRKHKNNNSL
ncbi:hypothetical protein ACQQ97_05405 [Anaerovoracaceae bacterium SGI.195]